MGISALAYKEILREYEKIRDESQKLLKMKQEKVYTEIPRIKEIDEMLASTGIRISRAIIENAGNSQNLIEKFKQENDELMAEKNQLLETNGYSKDALCLSYICKECKDTGYIGNKKCRCLEQKIIDKAYAQSNLRDVCKSENFDTFDFRYYSDEVDKTQGKSPRENIQMVYKICFDFANKFGKEFNNIILYGQSGLGKTFFCNCIAKDVLDKGYTVLYTTAFQLFKIVEEERFGKNKEEEESTHDYLNLVLNVDLLIIDDLGTEFATTVTKSELYNFVNIRLLEKRPTIISTNLAPNDWVENYSDRVVSRIQGNYKVLKIFGDDIRIKKKYQKL